jgi:hypothetical protein
MARSISMLMIVTTLGIEILLELLQRPNGEGTA